MKLHIPSGLRRALLACLAALAAPTATLCSASFSAASAVIVWAATASQAQASLSISGVPGMGELPGEDELGSVTDLESGDISSWVNDDSAAYITRKTGGGDKFISGGAAEMNLRLIKNGHLAATNLNNANDPTASALTLKALYLTSSVDPSNEDNVGFNNNIFVVYGGSYLQNVGHVYVDRSALKLAGSDTIDLSNTSFSIGSAQHTRENSDNCALIFEADTILKDLEVQETSGISFLSGAEHVTIGALSAAQGVYPELSLRYGYAADTTAHTLTINGASEFAGSLKLVSGSLDAGTFTIDTASSTLTIGGISNNAATLLKEKFGDNPTSYTEDDFWEFVPSLRSIKLAPSGASPIVITFDVASSKSYEATSVVFGENVSVVKRGEGEQVFYMVHLEGEGNYNTLENPFAKVEAGTLIFSTGIYYKGDSAQFNAHIAECNTTYHGAYVVESGGTLAFHVGSRVDNNKVREEGTDIFRGTLYVASGGVLEVGSSTSRSTSASANILNVQQGAHGIFVLDESADVTIDGSLSLFWGDLVLGQDLTIGENLYVSGYKGQVQNYANHIIAQGVGNDGVRTVLFDIDSGERLIKGESADGKSAELTLTENIVLKKTGAGTLKIDNALVVLQNGGKIIVEEGTLEAGVFGSSSGFRFEGPSSEIRIENGATLVMDEMVFEDMPSLAFDSFSGIITLAGGSTLRFKQLPATWGVPGQFLYGGILRAEGKGAGGEKNVFDTAEVGLNYKDNFIGQITSKTPDSADDTSELTIKLGNSDARLNVNKIYNYHGTIEVEKTAKGVTFLLCNVMEAGGSSSSAQMLSRGYGNVEQQEGYEGTLLVYDYGTDKASGTVEADVFRKIGDGTFALGRDAGGSDTPANQVTLKVNHRLFMDYAGNLMMHGGSKIVVGDGVRLTYEKMAEEQMVKLNYDDIKGLNMLQLDFVEYKEDFNVLAEEGMALGIYTKDADESARAAALERLWKQTEGSEEGVYVYDENSLLCLYRLDESKIKLTLEWRPRGIDSLWPDYQNGGNDAWMLWMKAEISPTAFDSTYWDAQWGSEALFAPEADAMARKELDAEKVSEYGFKFTGTEGDFDTEGNNLQLGYNYQYGTSSIDGLDWAGALPSHQSSSDPNAQLSGSGNSPFVDRLGDLVDDSDGRGAFLLKDGKVMLAVRLVGGGAAKDADTKATVMGGRLYTAADEADEGYDYNGNKREWWVVGESYISLRPSDAAADDGHFHLLIGGSSCVAERTPELDGNPVGGFRGNSHIQMEGGSVDYIVGGNHVNNSAFQFDGNSYISVLSGEVNGGIVGGCTLTRGASNTNVYAFRGTSTIFIYEVLGGKDAPDISDGTPSSEAAGGGLSSGMGAAFNAVVGGNAWIDIARSVQTQEGVTPMNPTFFGNSYITIDLLTGKEELGFGEQTIGVREGKFEKAIVGGNYTVYQGSDDTLYDVLGARSTLFRGNTYISIKASDEVVFTEGINGASRRNALGSGETNFTGNTSVTLAGGIYQAEVVGGFWMSASASGDHHTRLEGNTSVTVKDGTLWRVIGGSLAQEGGEDSQKIHVGTSSVVVDGGVFESHGDGVDVTEISFVSGGDFYRNNNGSIHNHWYAADDVDKLNLSEDDLNVVTSVTVTRGDFIGAHIVGGDSANVSPHVDAQLMQAAEASQEKDNTMSASILGISQVVLGDASWNLESYKEIVRAAESRDQYAWAEGDEFYKSIRVKGLVIGGSYLTDEGSGGGATVGGTSVDIGKGVFITGEDGHDSHKGMAVVGGSLLRDMGDATGNHDIIVMQNTEITVRDGATIHGSVVGGSYVTDAAHDSSLGGNTLTSGSVAIKLQSCSITGSVYGGHFSENQSSPDTLHVGDIDISVNGAAVTGNIVGGGYRATKNDHSAASEKNSSSQGAITIELTTGSLKGNVYAAGYNAAVYEEGSDAENHVDTTTKSTSVTVGKGFVFDASDKTDQSIESGILISGGYGRADSGVGRGTIGGSKEEAAHVAKLIFEGTNESINAQASDITFGNFDYVEVQEGEIKVATDFYVLRRFEEQADNDIYKTGVGTLSVRGLTSWNKLDDGNESANRYTGHITVHQGYLKLTGADAKLKQDVSNGISFWDLGASQIKNNASNAYLSSAAGLMTAINDGLNADNADNGAARARVKVDFAFNSMFDFDNGDKDDLKDKLKGDYYLASGFDKTIYNNATRSDYFDYVDALSKVQAEFEKIGLMTDVIMIGNSLVLSIYELLPWTWMGIEGNYGLDSDHGTYSEDVAMVWYDDYRYNWSDRELGDEVEDNQPTKKDVHFSGNGTGVVKIHEMVTPRSVDVNSGIYIYEQEEGTTGGLSIGSLGGDAEDDDALDAGTLSIGGKQYAGGEYADAHLTLALANTAVPQVLLKEGGVLVLNHAQALVSGSGDADTSISFEGGTLGYLGDDIVWAPYDKQVDANSSGKAKVRVGNTLQGVGAVQDPDDAAGRALSITWGGVDAYSVVDGTHEEINNGVYVALTNGMLKTGVGTFTLEWQEVVDDDCEYTGTIDVYEGALIYQMHGNNELSFTATDTITIGTGAEADMASLTLQFSSGDTGTVSLAGGFVGSGSVVLGSADDAGTYVLGGDSSSTGSDKKGFGGTVILVGKEGGETKGYVQLVNNGSLGGSKTTLRLAGRHFAYDASTTESVKTIALKEVQVVDDTITYVGGTDYTAHNAAITLMGTLSTVKDAAGNTLDAKNNGVLATAWGSDDAGFAHTYDGDISGFLGTIRAGAYETKGTATSATSNSSWTLTGNLTNTDISAKLDGDGTIIFNYGQDVRLVGKIGNDDAAPATNNHTSLQNVGNKKVTIADGSTFTWWQDDTTRDTSATGKNVSVGSLSGDISLGDGEFFGTWWGTELVGEGVFTMVNGILMADGGIASKSGKAQLAVSTIYIDDKKTSTHVDAGGTAASLFDSINVTLGGQLRGVTGQVNTTTTDVTLQLGEVNVDKTQGTADRQYLLVTSKDTSGQSGLKVTDESNFTLDLSNDGFREVVNTIMSSVGRREEGDVWLHVVQGGDLIFADEDGLSKMLNNHTSLTSIFNPLGFVADTEGGDIHLRGRLREIYLVIDPEEDTDPHLVTEYGSMSNGYKATFVDSGQTLTISLNSSKKELEDMDDDDDTKQNGFYMRDLDQFGGLVVNNLVGMKTSTISVTNQEYAMVGDDLDPSRRVTIVFLNTQYKSGEILGADDYEEDGVLGVDTAFEGLITAGKRVDFDKRGGGVLTIGSRGAENTGLLAEDAAMTIYGGGLTLSGKLNTLSSISFAWDDEVFEDGVAGATMQLDAPTLSDDDIAAAKAKRKLTLVAGVTKLKTISEDADWTDNDQQVRRGGDIRLCDGAVLQLVGASEWNDSTIRNGSSGSGTLYIDKSGSLNLLGDDQMSGIAGYVDGCLKLNDSQKNSLLSLGGSGEVYGNNALLTITGNDANAIFSGILTGSGNKLIVDKGAGFTLLNATTAYSGGSGWDLENRGSLLIDMGSAPVGDHQVRLHDLTLASGSNTTLKLNVSNWLPATTVYASGSLTFEDNATLTVDGSDGLIKNSALQSTRTGNSRFALMQVREGVAGMLEELPNDQVVLVGRGLLHYEAVRVYWESGWVWLELNYSTRNRIDSPDMEKNPKAGAELFWEASDADKNPNAGVLDDPDSDLGKILDGISHSMQSGDFNELCTTLAAGAGAATSVLGPALLEDMHRQLRSIRNRAAQPRERERFSMATEEEDLGKAGINFHSFPVLTPAPQSNFWVSAEGNYDHLNSDRYAPGYTLNNWGGTLGVETQLSRDTSVGLALTAMYGRLRVEAADSSRGHMDTSYVTAFACVADGSWNHTFIASAGLASVDLTRTVNHHNGSYRTFGETEGYTLGALYEASYSFIVDKESAWVLQPVFNVDYRFVHLNGYTETGSDAGLHVGGVSQSLASLGAGVRSRAKAGYSAFNRDAFYELRALAKADVGERAGRVNNALINSSARREELKSARKGAVGAELGAGITIPVSESSSLFLDASLELRAHYSNADANIGYRVNF